MKLVLKGSEILSVINALDLYSRIWIGQYNHIMYEMRWIKDCEKLDAREDDLRRMFISLRNITLPELSFYGFSGSYGIFSPQRDIRAAVAYDLQQEIRYRRAWFEKPEGDYTVDFDKPLPCGDDPYPFPKAVCRKDGTDTVLYAEVVTAQAETIITALEIKYLMENGNFKELFSHYTQNEQAISCAEKITEIYAIIPDDTRFQHHTEELHELADKIRKQIPRHRAFFRCPFSNVDVMIADLAEDAVSAVCPVCKVSHDIPRNDIGRKRVWHRNRNMFMAAGESEK